METSLKAADNILGKNNKTQTKTQVQHGLVTPEATPQPEDARIAADKARQAAEAATAPGEQGMGESDDEEEEGDYEPGGGDTEEEREAIKRVMSCTPKKYRES